ncbi:hypothetical protein A2Z67_05345 [Candidatus Woesebacteria bacterium RBG_13_36_22]|uniref:Uncharacterized protein n=1 Tax=Candidatus Woesebacteria bacterium RBG_13_36_22 TaxID=1802478 RepID=A0A1F7X6B4_9BACT|nr:MAG: hypothetical protein A2Z67_05345 [Candidatus Woesebacteria bacterium RBG_13_36_22]
MVNCELLRSSRKRAVEMGQNPTEVNCPALDCDGIRCSFQPSENNSIVSSMEDEIQEEQLKHLEGKARVDRFYKILEKHSEIRERLLQ